ncbi:hypothetical protein ACFXQA_14505 [Microbacterium sp. P07]|uniref:hypothetical protein n=1 Tax=Microbacterium sp. P07 TaxID=3366952 RepID=UPI0037462912
MVPHKAFVFNPDLSIHSEGIIIRMGSTVPVEYVMPPNGAIVVPVRALVSGGAHLKHTPHSLEPILGPAHHSLYGATLTPTKADKADMRDALIAQSEWVGDPPQPEPPLD